MTIEASPAPTSGPLFFSYAHNDRDKAAAIITALEKAGHTVWWDDHIEGGAAFASTIEDALDAASAVIVLWSKNSVQSHWVSDEAAQGRDAGRLVPIAIDGVKPPLGFRQLHYINMEGWSGAPDAEEFERLLRAIAKASGGTSTSATPTPRENPNPFASSRINRRRAIIAGGAIAAALAGGAYLFRPRSALADNGVAVLPFRNLSGDPQQDYLSAGLSAEVRSVLARNAALRVVAQASCEAIRQRGMDAAEMAKALAVSFLLDGFVRREDNRLQVSAELIDGRTGFSRWSQSFDRPLSELPTVQDAIADAVTSELAVRASENGASAAYGVTANAAAFNDYLKGRELYESAVSRETDLAALSHFDRAIERDGAFGAALAAKARTLTVLGNGADDAEKARLFYDSARQAAEMAVEAGPSSADAYSTLGYVLFQAQLRIRDARAPFEKSFVLGAGEATVQARYAAYAAATGAFDKAEKAVNRARDLDGLNANIHRAVGFVHYAAGRYAASIAAVERALDLNPDLSDSHARIAMALIQEKRMEDAFAVAQKERYGLVRYPALAISAHRLGKTGDAENALAALKADYGDAGLYQQAQILAGWDRADDAMATLERAHAQGDSGLTYLFIDPCLASVRTRSDFQQLLKQLGFV